MAETQHPSIILCPYCGHIQQLTEQTCEACGGFFDRLSLKATQVAMGPWFIHNAKKPFKPGCSYDVIKKQAAAGRIHSRTIMRGPTTRQFWSFAKNVPGVAHLIGYCHNCGLHVTPTDPKCSKCNAPFREVTLRNEMGLLYPTTQEAAKAQEQLEKETAQPQAQAKHNSGVIAPTPSTHASEPINKAAPGDDLLDEVIGRVEKQTGGKAAPRPAAAAPAAAPAAAKHSVPIGATPPAKPASPGLDLGAADDDEPTPEPKAPKTKSNALLIVMLVLGLICVLAIQVAIWVNMEKSGTTHTIDPTSGTGSDLTNQTNNLLPPPPKAPPAAPAETPAAPVKPKPAESTPSSSAPQPPANPAANTGNALANAAASTPAAPEKKPETFQERFKQALQLEEQKKYKEALAILDDLQKKTPLNQIPKEMWDATRRLQSKVAQQSTAPLFEAP